jgi:hypothetical protein
VVVGPYQSVSIGGGRSADLYLLRYGPDGALLSLRTEQQLTESLDEISDVFLFSHGWNNTFDGAAASYRTFIEGYVSQGTGPGPGHRPLLVGVVWPSISFLMPWEDGPQIAGDARADPARTEEMRAFVAQSLDRDAEARLSELVDGTRELAPVQARQAAEIVRDALVASVDPDDGSVRPTVDEILRAWATLDGGAAARPGNPDDFGDLGSGAGTVAAADTPSPDPRAAGVSGSLDPRNLLRMGTVWKMKGRAGQVGAFGVGPLVRRILGDTPARLHLVGHSFGARLLMSALVVAAPARQARSMLLLEPAVNRWCFAADVVGTGRAGGYRPVLELVELPILATYSEHDFPLRQAFHLAVRGSSLGEPNIAAVGDTERFGALGGYGPAGLGAVGMRQQAVAAGGDYNLSGRARVIAVDGSGDIDGKPAIGGHSDINNPTTWWALRCLVNSP